MAKKPAPLVAIFLIVFVDVLGFTIVIPLLPFYAEKYGGSPAVYGLLVTTYAICQLFSGPLLGRLSDHVGRKPLLLLSQAGTFVGFLILARAHSLAMIFLSRIIDGSTAGNLSLAQAYISDVTTPANRAKAFGLIGMSFGIGFLIGPGISGYLSQFGYHYPPLAAALASFASIMGTIFLLPTVKKEGEEHLTPKAKGQISLLQWKHYGKFFENKDLTRLLLQFFLFSFAFSMFIAGFALFAERRFTVGGRPFGPREVGYLMAYSGLLGIFVQGGLLGRMVKAFGERRLVTLGFMFMAIGYAAMGFVHPIWLLMFVMIFSSIGTGVLRPAITSLITQCGGKGEQGTLMGLNQTLMSIASIVAPMLTGLLLSAGLLIPWALIAGAMGVFGMLLSRRSIAAG